MTDDPNTGETSSIERRERTLRGWRWVADWEPIEALPLLGAVFVTLSTAATTATGATGVIAGGQIVALCGLVALLAVYGRRMRRGGQR